MDELCISPVYRRLAVAKFSKSTRDPDHAHLGNTHSSVITRLRLHMADPCTKFEASTVSRCGDITWGVKF